MAAGSEVTDHLGTCGPWAVWVPERNGHACGKEDVIPESTGFHSRVEGRPLNGKGTRTQRATRAG